MDLWLKLKIICYIPVSVPHLLLSSHPHPHPHLLCRPPSCFWLFAILIVSFIIVRGLLSVKAFPQQNAFLIEFIRLKTAQRVDTRHTEVEKRRTGFFFCISISQSRNSRVFSLWFRLKNALFINTFIIRFIWFDFSRISTVSFNEN